MVTRIRTWIAVAGLGALAVVPALAHDVPVEQVVRMIVRPEPGQLAVSLHVPLTLLAEAGLPTLEDGRADAAVGDAALRIVAADIVRNLDFRRDDVALTAPEVAVRIGADQRSVDVNLAYRLAGPAIGLSARLNAFQGTPRQPPRSDVRYRSAGSEQLTTVTGPPQRVSFDPGLTDAVRTLAAEAVGSVIGGGQHLLFLLCLLLPARKFEAAARPIAALVAAQLIAILAVTAAPSVDTRTAMALIAASMLVAAAVCTIAGSTIRRLTMLAMAFGVFSGAGFGARLADVAQFAGAHQIAGRAAFALVAVTAELWLAAVVWASRRWADSIGVPDQIVTVLGSALIAHSALHTLFERGRQLAERGSFVDEHAVVLVSLAWSAVMVTAAAWRWARSRRPIGATAGRT